MNQKLKKLITNWRIITLVIVLVLSVIAINPDPGIKGVSIRAVAPNSSASAAGITVSKELGLPKSKEIITSIDQREINSIEDYHEVVSSLKSNSTIILKTNKRRYSLRTREQSNIVDLGLTVVNAPKTNVRKGLDLQGGTRVLLQPEEILNAYDLGVLIDNMKERLNVYGLSDIVIREAGDLSGNQYIIVEIAGATETEIKELLAEQGKFEAKVANQTVFRGGSDITFVCRSADCSGIDPKGGCSGSGNQWSCGFRFTIALTQEAAQRQANATKDLGIVEDSSGKEILSEKLYFYLDDKEVDQLNIAAELKGEPSKDIQITGGGFGISEQAAALDALQNMKRLQTILITGSLPVKINLVKTDSISPVLGEGFVKNSILMAIFAIIAVAIVLVVRYRKLIIAIPIIGTMLSEVLILFGIASFIGWNIDLAAIAGILAAIGTGVDDQIVITDETLRGSSAVYSWKQRLKRAFMIIMLAYLTVVVAMIPLIFAGAGLLKGFAITTIIGVTGGVFITRPAYGAFVEIFLK